MRLKNILLNNLGIKLLALILAFITWFYVVETTELGAKKTILQRIFSPTRYISKKLDVVPVFVGNVPKGYALERGDVKVDPEYLIVLGPMDLLISKEHIYTQPIELGEYTKTRTIEVEPQNISRSIKFQKTNITVYIPITKLEAKTE